MKLLRSPAFGFIMALFLIVVGIGTAGSAHAGKIVNEGDKLVCAACYNTRDIAVTGAEPASFYKGVVETPNFAFIQEDLGSSCYGGGWSIIDKRVPNPGLVPVETECKEITSVKAFESNGKVFFKVTYYGRKPVVYEFKM